MIPSAYDPETRLTFGAANGSSVTRSEGSAMGTDPDPVGPTGLGARGASRGPARRSEARTSHQQSHQHDPGVTGLDADVGLRPLVKQTLLNVGFRK